MIYEDEHILLVNKPEGILSQKAEADDISMVEEAQRYLLNNGAVTEESLRTFRPSVVNRLDRNTSGILAVGKDLAGAQELSRLFKERSLHKYYYCLVKGQVKEKARIKGYLVKNEATNRVTVEKEPIGKDSHRDGIHAGGQRRGTDPSQSPAGDGPDPSDPRPSLLHRPSDSGGP